MALPYIQIIIALKEFVVCFKCQVIFQDSFSIIHTDLMKEGNFLISNQLCETIHLDNGLLSGLIST